MLVEYDFHQTMCAHRLLDMTTKTIFSSQFSRFKPLYVLLKVEHVLHYCTPLAHSVV
jgi:hypothetical protein